MFLVLTCLFLSTSAPEPDAPRAATHLAPQVEFGSQRELSLHLDVDAFPRSSFMFHPQAPFPLSFQWNDGPHVGVEGLLSWAVVGVGYFAFPSDSDGAGLFSPLGAKVAAAGLALTGFDLGWQGERIQAGIAHRFRWLDFRHPIERLGPIARVELPGRTQVALEGYWALSTSGRFSGPGASLVLGHALKI